MKYIGLIALMGWLALSGCEDALEDYYGDEDLPGLSSVEIIDRLKSEPGYSEFVALLEETGYAGELQKDLLFTVWAPQDATMPDTVKRMSLESKKELVENHLSYMVIYQRNLEKLQRVKTLAGKYLLVTNKADGFNVGGAGLENADRVCRNGVVHGVQQWLLPRKSIYEWLNALGEDYSIFRDSLMARNVRIFDKENSVPNGVDEMGQTVYDTVWKTGNPILDKGDIRLEDKQFTLFIPDNDVILTMYRETAAYLDEVKRQCKASDTAQWIDWLLRAAVHKNVIEVKEGKSYQSVFAKEMRMSVQQAGEYTDLSNGRAYRLTHCHIPRDIYFKTVEFNPYYNRLYAPGEYDWVSQLAEPMLMDDAGKVVRIQFPGDTICEFSFLTYDFNVKELFHPVEVMPGNYKVTARFDVFFWHNKDSEADSMRIWMNGAEIAKIEGLSPAGGKLFHDQQGLVAKSVWIGDTLGPVTVKLKTLTPDPEKMNILLSHTRMAPGRFVLTPTDNY